MKKLFAHSMLKLLKIILQAMKQLLMYICMLCSTNFIFGARGACCNAILHINILININLQDCIDFKVTF